METREQASAEINATATTLPGDSKNESAELTETAQPETIENENPEAVAEQIMTDGEEEATAQEAPKALTREELTAIAREMLERDAADITADDVRRLRQLMNTLRTDGDETDREVEDELTEIFNALREKKAQHTARVEAEQLANLERKRAIIDQINALAEDTDNVNRTFPRYRELQDEFNSIGDVPPTEDTATWKSFQEAREHYSDNLKINKELRDYDFKKNLDSKQLLLAEAQDLITDDDVITAYRRLQELHNKWRRIGPVAKEFRDEIWDKFKTASAEINKRYQAHFEARKAREAENEAGKLAIIAALEAIDTESLKNYAAWEKATATVMDLQQQWRTWGFASKKMNKALFGRFRELCDKFFAAKAEFFQATRDELASNLARKTALAERAEALKDSTEWKAVTDELVELQKQWKTIGAVAKKHSDAVWRRFMDACDHFFEQKKKATGNARKEENENLRAKREIIASLDDVAADTPREQLLEMLKSAQEKWKAIGHVPFREKDKVYDAFRARLDALRELLNQGRAQQRRERFNQAVQAIEGDDRQLMREREKLTRALEARRKELITYENNLGFLTSKSKSGNSFVQELERKAQQLRADIAELEEKIKTVTTKL